MALTKENVPSRTSAPAPAPAEPAPLSPREEAEAAGQPTSAVPPKHALSFQDTLRLQQLATRAHVLRDATVLGEVASLAAKLSKEVEKPKPAGEREKKGTDHDRQKKGGTTRVK